MDAKKLQVASGTGALPPTPFFAVVDVLANHESAPVYLARQIFKVTQAPQRTSANPSILPANEEPGTTDKTNTPKE
jgi:hypothetical protein